MPLAAFFAIKGLVFVSYFCPELCAMPQFPFLHTRGNNCGDNLVFVRAVGTQPQSTPYSYHKAHREWKSSTKGRAKQKQNGRGFCPGQVPRAESPSCQCHLSASKEGAPWGPDPSLCGVLGCTDPAVPARGDSLGAPCCSGCCASSHPCCCLTGKVTRHKEAMRGKSCCSASLQYTDFPLLLSTAQESLKIYPEFPGPLSLASRQLMGWRNWHAQPWRDLGCSVTPKVLSALSK